MKKCTSSGIPMLIVLVFIFHGCATIMGGKTNTLVFKNENASKAVVFIDGEFVGEAPGKIKLPKGKIQHGSVLVIKADGYFENEYLILRKQHAIYSVADILIGGIPLAVDYSTGNIYRPKPRIFEYKLVNEK